MGGVLVVVPDLYHGNPYPVDQLAVIAEKLPEWAKLYPDHQVVSDLSLLVSNLKSQFGVTHLLFGGFCWGSFFPPLLIMTSLSSSSSSSSS